MKATAPGVLDKDEAKRIYATGVQRYGALISLHAV